MTISRKTLALICVLLVISAVAIGIGTFHAVKYFTGTPMQSGSGEAVPDFVLLDQRGQSHRLRYRKDASAIVIVSHGNGCPLVQKGVITLNEMANKYKDKGVIFWMLNANTQDTREAVRAEAREFNLELPVLMDPTQIIAQTLGFQRTAEAIVINPRDWSIVYRGAIDDRFQLGALKPEAQQKFLEDALDAMLSSRKIPVAQTESIGCKISFPTASYDYAKDVAPILQEKCLNCHSQGNHIQPFLTCYENVKGWSAMIRETLLTQRMPPWGLDPHFGKFANDSSLTEQETRTLFTWIESGMPRKEGPDPLHSPEVKTYSKSILGTPDFTFDIGVNQIIPPEGFLEYQYYQLAGPMDQDTIISSVRAIPDLPGQIHHIAVLVVDQPLKTYIEAAKKIADDKKIKSKADGAIPFWTLMEIRRLNQKFDNYVQMQVYSSGRRQLHMNATENNAILLPKGSYLIAQMHYNGSGKQEVDRTRFDLYKYSGKTKPQIIRGGYLIQTNLEIPPNDPRFVVHKMDTVKKAMHILTINPHMHMRGRSLRMDAKFPDGHWEPIFSIPNYYYGWHVGLVLILKEPLAVPKGTVLRMTAVFDNSKNNPYNPDPSKTVYFGQKVDKAEMPKISYTYTDDADPSLLSRAQ